ncbi:hypothetical protein [Shewanella sp. S1-58-MNA-CIBAN-0166]|uniref:hypothetical protein n=1 Tax=Shewanella sp. S1-58-MNA-CIBAN-0166 TaxID=3140467 RepID=UPI00331D5FE3
MGNRGPKKGKMYRTDEFMLKVLLHRRLESKPTWDDTVRYAYPSAEGKSKIEVKGGEVRDATRLVKNFKGFYINRGITGAKELERIINKPLSGLKFDLKTTDDNNYLVTFFGSDKEYIFTKENITEKFNEIGAAIDGNVNELPDLLCDIAPLIRALKLKRKDEQLMGNEHLQVVSIGNDETDILTKKEVFAKLEEAHQRAIESITASQKK